MLPLNDLASLPKAVVSRLAQSWQACVMAGALSGVLLFSPLGILAPEKQAPKAAAADIDRAVSQAEKAGAAARKGETSSPAE